MKRLALSIILCLFAVSAVLAQNISVKSFASDPTDLTARVHPVKDENARNCALLKIITTETGFSFQPDAMGICKEVEFHTDSAEIWVWLAPGSRRITIAHPQLGQLRNYEYPEPIEPSTVYVMELATGKITTIVEEQNTTNYLALDITPAEAAVKIDGNIVVLKDGQFQNRYAVGTHSYEAYCDLYYPTSGRFEIKSDETTQLSIELQPNYGFLKVTSEPESGATVFINSKNVGTTPYTSDKLESKTYTVQVAKELWHNATQQVVVTDNQTANVNFTLQPDFAEPVFTCGDSEAEIWINDVKKGTGSWTGRLSAGVYKVETRKTAHRTAAHTFTLNSGDNRHLTLDAPTPIYGTIDVTSDPFGADIYLDGKKVGTTPKIISNVLIGSHEIKLQKAGFAPMTRSAAVKEGETVEIAAELPAGRSITVKSEPESAAPVAAAPPQKSPSPQRFFFTLNFDYSALPQYAGTLRLGTVAKYGWNIALTTDFSAATFNAQELSAGSYDFIDKKTTRWGATAGFTCHPTKHFLFALNLGYGYRSVCYKPQGFEDYFIYRPHTYSGVETSLTFMLNARGVLFSVEAATINFKYFEMRFGAGGIFRRK